MLCTSFSTTWNARTMHRNTVINYNTMSHMLSCPNHQQCILCVLKVLHWSPIGLSIEFRNWILACKGFFVFFFGLAPSYLQDHFLQLEEIHLVHSSWRKDVCIRHFCDVEEAEFKIYYFSIMVPNLWYGLSLNIRPDPSVMVFWKTELYQRVFGG